MRSLLSLLALATLTGAGPSVATPAAPSRLFVWISDSLHKSSDYLAVIDADPASRGYGRVLSTLPVGAAGMAHHTEAELGATNHLLANDFDLGRTWLFDLSDADHPRILTSFGDVAGFTHPHSFIRLGNGLVLATFQYLSTGADHATGHDVPSMMSMSGTGQHFTGGLVEMSERGRVVAARSAHDASSGDPHIYPYSVVAMPAIDRAVSTTTDMDEADTIATSKWIQIWRLSDLSLLRTVALPTGPRHNENEYTGEPRVLADGHSVYIHTFNCGLYLIRNVADTSSHAMLVRTFDGINCGVPVLTGHFWLQPVPDAHALVALDVSDAAHPREVSRVSFGNMEHPHWAAIDPTGRRIVVNSGGKGSRLFIVNFDPATGSLALDDRFRDSTSRASGIEMAHRSWPGGFAGTAMPHGAVFSR